MSRWEGFSLAQDRAGSQLVVPSCETVCVFEKGEILCAAHLSFLLLTDDSGLFVGSLLCVRLQDQPENQAGWREEYFSVTKCSLRSSPLSSLLTEH